MYGNIVDATIGESVTAASVGLGVKLINKFILTGSHDIF
jgi:hypothetical protein